MVKTLIEIGADIVDAAEYEIPTERTFRDAWTLAGDPTANVISVDMDKAKDIWRNKIRAARVGELEALDTQFMKALETGADTTDIVTKKQALRDAPADPAIDAATTPEDLKLVQPAGLIIE